jgi:hypothetical protein
MKKACEQFFMKIGCVSMPEIVYNSSNCRRAGTRQKGGAGKSVKINSTQVIAGIEENLKIYSTNIFNAGKTRQNRPFGACFLVQSRGIYRTAYFLECKWATRDGPIRN